MSQGNSARIVKIENDIEKEIGKYSKDYTYTQIFNKLLILTNYNSAEEIVEGNYDNLFWIKIFIIQTLLNKIIEKENLEIKNRLNKKDKLILIINMTTPSINKYKKHLENDSILEIIKQYCESEEYRKKANEMINKGFNKRDY